MSKSETKEPNHFSPSHTNRGIMRFYQAHSVLVAAFVTDLDTPHRSKALCTSGEPHGRSHSPASLLPHSPRSGQGAPCHPADLPSSRTVILLSG